MGEGGGGGGAGIIYLTHSLSLSGSLGLQEISYQASFPHGKLFLNIFLLDYLTIFEAVTKYVNQVSRIVCVPPLEQNSVKFVYV